MKKVRYTYLMGTKFNWRNNWRNFKYISWFTKYKWNQIKNIFYRNPYFKVHENKNIRLKTKLFQ